MNKCRCGVSKNLFYVRDPLTGACGWMCQECNKARFPKGSTVFMFKDTSHKHHARYYVVATEREEIMRLGEWGQKRSENVVHVYVYSGWNNGSRNGVSAFNLGHSGSVEHLAEILDGINARMSEVVVQTGMIQTTLE